jgi:putative two-component system hydrogenase maturation factor HypX/HoxX
MSFSMRILFLTHSFNSLTQRLYVEFTRLGHEVSIEFDINDAVTREAVALFVPDIVIAPFLKRAIPEDIWRAHTCIILHPGIPGDRGPSALDWAVLEGETSWGVTALQAEAEMDAGPIWAAVEFPMRPARKSSLYRNEVTEAAVQALTLTLARFASGNFVPTPPDQYPGGVRGRMRPVMKQADRAIDWAVDDTETVLRKMRSADGQPGVLDIIHGESCYLYNGWPEGRLRGEPGAVIATRHGAICRATRDGAVWITHLRRPPADGEPTCKLPATQVLGELLAGVPEAPVADEPDGVPTYREIRYEERDGVGYLHFDFYNGAMGSSQCERLLAAYREAAASRRTRVIDLAEAIITTDSHLTVSALQGNAGAGGVFLALAADRVLARSGVVLNPHYKSMGNLFGSEYWTYLLPRRVGAAAAERLAQNRLPVGAPEAQEAGLIDEHFGNDLAAFREGVERYAERLAGGEFEQSLAAKNARRAEDEAAKPLTEYRREELEQMKLNFYGFDPSYHVARYHFVFKVPHSRTPFYLARHRVDAQGARRTS